MYNISQDLMDVVNNPEYTAFGLFGVITDGETLREFHEDNILQGSLYVTNQVSNGDSFTLGSVAIGEMRCTLVNFKVHKREDIYLNEQVRLEDDTYETVPIGVFTVAEAKKTAYGLDIVAYDHMAKFDKGITLTTTEGTMYQFARLACRACGVELGMTQEEMQALPNGNRVMTLSQENDIITWRDLLFWVAQTMCGIATIDREGKLVFRVFHDTVDTEINDDMRMQGASFSNLSAKYTGVSAYLTDREEEFIVIDQQADDTDNIYALGANPFIQNLGDEGLNAVLGRIKDTLTTFNYFAMDLKMRIGSFYDLFDVVRCVGGLIDEDDERQGIIMYWSWHYGHETTIKCVRANVELKVNQARNQTSKGGGGGGKASEITYEAFQNAAAISVADGGSKRLVNINFSTSKETVVIFQGEILLTSTASTSGGSTVAKVTYTIDESEEQYYYPTETWDEDGKHILSLMYVLSFPQAGLHHFVADIDASGGTLQIPVGNCRAVIYGQGMSVRPGWDGLLNLEEGVTDVEMSESPSAIGFIDEDITIDLISELDIDVEQASALVSMGASPTVTEMSDVVYINRSSIYYDGMLWADMLAETWGAIYDEHLW